MRHSLYLDRPNARFGLKSIGKKLYYKVIDAYNKYFGNYTPSTYNLSDSDSSNITKDSNQEIEEPKESYWTKFERKSNEINATDLTIPFIEDKKVKLTNAGLATGAVLSTNLLDSIAKYATIEGLPIKTAIGLATKESTLGNPTYDRTRNKLTSSDNPIAKVTRTEQYINDGQDIDAYALLNFNKGRENPYSDAIQIATSKASKLVQKEGYTPTNNEYYNRYDQLVDSILKAGERYADRQASKIEKRGNILQEAFKYYKNHPNNYNPGQSNYQELVNRRADEVWNSPEIQEWYKNYISKRNGGRISLETL